MEMKQIRNVATFILAGGRGERLGPLTEHRAKPAVPFGDARIIDFTLSNCLRSHLSHPFILTQYHANSLHQHVGRWWRQHASEADAGAAPVCVPSLSGANYRGTADALLQNLERFQDSEYVVVLSADHVYNLDYQELLRSHVEAHAAVTVGAIVCPKRSARQFGVMDVDSTWRVRGFQEKPLDPAALPGRPDAVLASMGIYVFNADVLRDALQQGGHDIGRDLMPRLVASRPVHAFNFADKRTGASRYWRDIGTLDSYYASAIECYGVGGSVISEDAVVHKSATVTDSILLPGVKVERGALVRRAILADNVYVPAGARIGYGRHDCALFPVTANGIVVVPANVTVPPTPTLALTSLQPAGA
jgi:glucose-1-phosphate adenylyltransferase